MTSGKSKASGLEYFLIIVIVLIVLAIGGGLYYAQNLLNEKASTIKESIDQSNRSDNPATLMSVINANRIYIDKAAAMTTNSSSYQAQLEKDLNLYANSTGVSIKSIDYDVSYNTQSSLSQGNLQTKFVKITFNNPITYTGFIKFLQALETNLPKMQVMNLKIDGNIGSTDAVTVSPINIKIYTDNQS